VPPPWRGRASLIAKTRAEFETGFPSYYLDLGLDAIVSTTGNDTWRADWSAFGPSSRLPA
jgi:hypothetical protein